MKKVAKVTLPILPPEHIVALSGGSDSTCMAVYLKEQNPHIDYTYLITPTGSELPEMLAHWEKLEGILGKPLTRLSCGYTLTELIRMKNCLPNHRMRWCTETLKIKPCLLYMRQRPGSTLYVGLRADEETRKGLYDSEINTVCPLRDAGFVKHGVVDFLACRGITIPKRTDCAECYDQRIGEWQSLYFDHPDIWADKKQYETLTGHTFRNKMSMEEMETRFRSRGRQLALFDDGDVQKCRVCSL